MRKSLSFHSSVRYFKYIVLVLLFYPLTVLGAQGHITVKGQSITIKEAIMLIEKNSNYVFFYNAADLKNIRLKNINCSGPIDKVLNEVFANTGITYLIQGNDVVLKVSKTESAQQAKKTEIVGVVTDARTGEAVIGASVAIVGTTTGVITDIDGKFVIQAGPQDVLKISYVGYTAKEVKVGNRKVLAIDLSEDAQALEEVVVTAYGTGQKKASMVGSVQAIRPAELKVPSTNLSNSFAGRLSGVVAVQRTGRPGADGSDFWIRGISTLSGATSPLIIIDGVQVSSADLNALDPEVIDGFSILKDATATAMYGTRGANGVMIVTTKSGQNLDKPIINFRVEGQISQPTKTPKFVDGATYMELFNEAVKNDGSPDVLYSQDKINGTRMKLNPYVFPDVNWYDEMFNDVAFNEKVNFNIRGGGKKIDYFSSISVNHESGMLKNRSKDFFSYNNNIDVMRYAFQNNINAYLSKSSKLSVRLNVQLRDLREPNRGIDDIFADAMNSSPVEAPVFYEPDGTTNHVKWGTTDRLITAYQGNPVAQLTTGYNDTFESTVIAALEFEQKLDFLTKGLRFKALGTFKNWSKSINKYSGGWNKYLLGSYEQNEDGSYSYTTNRVGNEVSTDLNSTNETAGDRRIYLEAMVDYNRTFGRHDVNAMLLYNQDELVNNVPGNNLINSLPKRKQGLAGRLSYAYDGKYMAEVNMGYNGSENFAKGHRWGFFPSIALGYNISEESFFEPLRKVITSMKLRGSWGLVGNDQIGGERFIYMPTINLSGKGFTTGIDQNYGLSGPVYTRYENNSITWEVGEKINLGIDLQLLNSLNIVVDIFRETRRDIFQKKGTIPTYLGTGNTDVFGNLAEMKNQGLDLSIDYNKAFSKDFYMNFKGTFTYAHNEITKYDEAPKYAFQSKVGQSANVSQGYLSNGLFLDEAEIDRYNQQMGSTLGAGDIKYLNVSNMHGYGDDIVDVDDWTWIGNPTVPEIVYGFGPSFKYKNWDFSFFFQGVAKTSLFMSGFHPFGDNSLRNVLQFVANDRWSPTNQNVDAKYPRLTRKTSLNNTNPGNSGRTSDYWMRDGSFLKLKNMELGYTFKRMRFYISGSNLLTFSKFDLWDPEQGGGSGLKYPTQRVFNVGFQMTFNN